MMVRHLVFYNQYKILKQHKVFYVKLPLNNSKFPIIITVVEAHHYLVFYFHRMLSLRLNLFFYMAS